MVTGIANWLNNNQGVVAVLIFIGTVLATMVGYWWRALRKADKSVDSTKALADNKATKKISSGKTETPRTKSSSNRTDLTPKNILDTLKKVPPYQRDQVKSNYYGLHVSWKGTYKTVLSVQGGSLLMILDRGNYPWIYAEIDLDKNPVVKILNEDAKVLVEGEITAIESGGVTLSHCRLKLL